MPAQNATYDLMLLLDPSTEDAQRTKVLEEVERIVADGGGSIASRHDWGARPTAYEIRHRGDADYRLVQFTGGPDIPAALGRYLRIADGVMRYRVIKLRPGQDQVPDLSAKAEAAEESAA
jgi:small subunit ribosomal protein S6